MARILLVDDEKNFVIVMKSRLENAGYEISAAYDGLEGIEKVYQEKPDLIIMLTARGKGLDLERIVAMEFGADAYLTKPFKPQVFLSKIKELLGEP